MCGKRKTKTKTKRKAGTKRKWEYRKMGRLSFRVDWKTGRREYKSKGKWRKVRPGQQL